MKNARDRYIESIHDQFKMLPKWPLGTPVELGDVGTLREGEFVRQTSLKQLGIAFEERAGGTPVPYEHTSNAKVSFKTDNSADVSPAHAAHAGVLVEFGSEGGFVFQAKDCMERTIDNMPALARALLAAADAGTWESDWVVVDTVYDAESTTVLLSNSAKASLELHATGDLKPGGLRLADAKAGLSVGSESGSVTKFIAQGKLTPLMHVSRLRPSIFGLFGAKKLERERGLKSLEAPAPDLDDAFEEAPVTARPGWHALVVGVDAYPALDARHQLRGCVNDALAVRDFLVNKVQVPEASVACLVAAEGAESGATAEKIRAAFEALLADVAVRAGDHVVIYYACHGLKLERRDADASVTQFYGLAPSDLRRAAGGYDNVILDRELHRVFEGLKERGASVTVIADTCHSGGSTRDADDEGAGERHLPEGPLADEAWRAFSARHPGVQAALEGGSRDVGAVGRFGAPKAGGDFVVLAACQDFETAKEFSTQRLAKDGASEEVKHGLLTLSLLQALEGVDPSEVRTLRWMDFYPRLSQTVAERARSIRARSQQPSLEGDPAKTVFGGDWTPFEPGFTVRNRDGALTVEAGLAHGLDAGAELDLYDPETPNFGRATPVARARVEASSVASSTLVLLGDAKPASVKDRARARLAKPAPGFAPMLVRMLDVPEALRAAALAVSGGFFEVAARAQAAHVAVRPWRGALPEKACGEEVKGGAWVPNDWAGSRDGWVIVRGDLASAPRGTPEAEPTPDDVIAWLPARGGLVDGATDAGLGSALGLGLAHYARYLRVRDLRSGDDALRSVVGVKLLVDNEPAKWRKRRDAGTAPDAKNALTPVDGVYTITKDQGLFVELRIKESTELGLRLGVLACSDDGNIVAVWPTAGQAFAYKPGEVVIAGLGDHWTPMMAALRPDQTRSFWTLKVFAYTDAEAGPIDLQGMVQTETVQGVLGAALAALAAGTRAGMSAPAEVEKPAWCTWDLRVGVTA